MSVLETKNLSKIYGGEGKSISVKENIILPLVLEEMDRQAFFNEILDAFVITGKGRNNNFLLYPMLIIIQ